jgi:uncharacterized membrane protein YebE (DUF533 family)
MAESPILSVIRVWAAVAWADGMLAESESEGLRRLIANAELTPEERSEAARVLDSKVAMPDAYLASLSEDARHGIYHAACKMAVVDHVLSDSERAILNRLRAKLEIPDDVADQLESDIPNLS